MPVSRRLDWSSSCSSPAGTAGLRELLEPAHERAEHLGRRVALLHRRRQRLDRGRRELGERDRVARQAVERGRRGVEVVHERQRPAVERVERVQRGDRAPQERREARRCPRRARGRAGRRGPRVPAASEMNRRVAPRSAASCDDRTVGVGDRLRERLALRGDDRQRPARLLSEGFARNSRSLSCPPRPDSAMPSSLSRIRSRSRTGACQISKKSVRLTGTDVLASGSVGLPSWPFGSGVSVRRPRLAVDVGDADEALRAARAVRVGVERGEALVDLHRDERLALRRQADVLDDADVCAGDLHPAPGQQPAGGVEDRVDVVHRVVVVRLRTRSAARPVTATSTTAIAIRARVIRRWLPRRSSGCRATGPRCAGWTCRARAGSRRPGTASGGRCSSPGRE